MYHGASIYYAPSQTLQTFLQLQRNTNCSTLVGSTKSFNTKSNENPTIFPCLLQIFQIQRDCALKPIFLFHRLKSNHCYRVNTNLSLCFCTWPQMADVPYINQSMICLITCHTMPFLTLTGHLHVWPVTFLVIRSIAFLSHLKWCIRLYSNQWFNNIGTFCLCDSALIDSILCYS